MGLDDAGSMANITSKPTIEAMVRSLCTMSISLIPKVVKWPAQADAGPEFNPVNVLKRRLNVNPFCCVAEVRRTTRSRCCWFCGTHSLTCHQFSQTLHTGTPSIAIERRTRQVLLLEPEFELYARISSMAGNARAGKTGRQETSAALIGHVLPLFLRTHEASQPPSALARRMNEGKRALMKSETEEEDS